MKAIKANELRAVEAGTTYRTFCGATFTDKIPLKLYIGLKHINWCATCRYAKGAYIGRWYTFNTRSAQVKAWGFSHN